MRAILISLSLMVGIFGWFGFGAKSAAAQTTGWTLLKRSDLDITNGKIKVTGDYLEIDTPTSRATVKSGIHRKLELDFTYLGPTSAISKLANGDVRYQLGIKLRAESPCNVVYAMWWFQPDKSGLGVSLKHNQGKKLSADCGDEGYRGITPIEVSPLPIVHAGETHVLRAYLNRNELTVEVDDRKVWRGLIDADALSFDGPVGIRTDNVHLKFKLHVGDRQ